MPLVKDVPVKIPREDVLRLLKHTKTAAIIDEKTSNLINKLIEQGKNLCEPKAVYADYPVKTVGEHFVVLEGSGFDILGKSSAHHLWNAKKVTLFAVTIGPKLEKQIAEFTKNANIASAAILDAVGSSAVESCANYLSDMIDTNAKKNGYKTIRRFSPGYGDWELREQRGLLSQLNALQIGIALTDSFLMQPEKSVSGVIGWVKGA